MARFVILKTGSTFPELAAERGDFEDWMTAGLGASRDDVTVVDAQGKDPLPAPVDAGIVVTGSPSMVTDDEEWTRRAADWLREAIQANLPVLGVCYGHQLLATAFDGEVDWNPAGPEIGTITVDTRSAARGDALLSELGPRFVAHATHSQSVRKLPARAVPLASSAMDPVQAFRLGDSAWGVQFHPEFDEGIMAAYVEKKRDEIVATDGDPDAVLRAIRPSPAGAVLRAFTAVCRGLLLPAIALGLSACSGEPPAPDALLLTIDTLRGDRWGCLGDPEARTPGFDRIARGGSLALEGRTPVPVTMPSHTSMMTGLPPAVHGVRDNGIFRLDPEAGTTLAEVMRASGWSTAAFVSAYPLLSGFGLDRGFDHYDNFLGSQEDELGGMRQRRAELTVERIRAWFDGEKAPPSPDVAPLFLWTHFFDPHANYEAPAPWPDLFPEDGYRAEIAYVDSQTRELLRLLAAKRAGRELQILVASDHGEGLNEHGESTHGALIHTSTIRVPIVTRGPDFAPRLLDGPRSIERVAATVLAQVGLDSGLDRNAAPPLDAPPTAVCAETLYPFFNFGWSGLRSREEDGWRLVAGPIDRLYRIPDDPGETVDLASEHPQIARRLREDLEEEWERREAIAFAPATRSLTAEDAKALRDLGYVAGGSAAAADLSQAFDGEVDPQDRMEIVDRINEGLTAIRFGLPARAIEVLTGVVKDDPDNRFAYEHLAKAYWDSGRLEEARDSYLAAIERGPCPDLVYLDLATVESGIGSLEGIRRALEGALAANPRSVETRYRLAQLDIESGENLDRAKRLLEEALEIRPRALQVHLNFALLSMREGDLAGAREHYERLAELDPDGRLGELARRALESL